MPLKVSVENEKDLICCCCDSDKSVKRMPAQGDFKFFDNRYSPPMKSSTLLTLCCPSTTCLIAFVLVLFCVIRRYNGGTVMPRSIVSIKYERAGVRHTERL